MLEYGQWFRIELLGRLGNPQRGVSTSVVCLIEFGCIKRFLVIVQVGKSLGSKGHQEEVSSLILLLLIEFCPCWPRLRSAQAVGRVVLYCIFSLCSKGA